MEKLPTQEKSEKEKHWQKIIAKVETITDKLGKPIDEGIKESIIALTVFDINTDQSCEGHLDHGLPSPWISFDAKENEELWKKLKEVTKKEDKEEDAQIRMVIHKNEIAERKKLMPFLDEFYMDRHVPYDRGLIITSARRNTLESQGAGILEVESDKSKKRIKMQEYQEEMKAFTDFLKRKYFEIGN